MKARDRVRELRRVRAGDLRPHPKNWRTHPRFQQDVWRGVVNEVGFADALLARELPDGSLQLLDGHLRASLTPSATVPVLIVDLDDAEAERFLLTHDPLGALAIPDEARLAELLGDAESASEAVRELLAKLGAEIQDEGLSPERPEVEIAPSYQVVVECDGESQQREIYQQLQADGWRCRVLTL